MKEFPQGPPVADTPAPGQPIEGDLTDGMGGIPDIAQSPGMDTANLPSLPKHTPGEGPIYTMSTAQKTSLDTTSKTITAKKPRGRPRKDVSDQEMEEPVPKRATRRNKSASVKSEMSETDENALATAAKKTVAKKKGLRRKDSEEPEGSWKDETIQSGGKKIVM